MVTEKMWIGDKACGHREYVDRGYGLWSQRRSEYGIWLVVTEKMWIGDTACGHREDVDRG